MKKKNLLIVVLVICAVFLLISCSTTMLANRAGYKHDVPDTHNSRSRPDWLLELKEDQENWMRELAEKDDDNHYFLGASELTLASFRASNKEERIWTWTDDNAFDEASRKAEDLMLNMVGVRVEMSSEYQREITDNDSSMRFRYESKIASQAFLGDRRTAYHFWEEWEHKRLGRKYTINHCWIIFSIPKTAIQNAQRDIEESRRRELIEELITERDGDLFLMLSHHFRNTMDSLEASATDDDLDRGYVELLLIQSSLRELSTLRDTNDYRNLITQLNIAINKYNPADRRGAALTNFERQNAVLHARLEEKNKLIDDLIGRLSERPLTETFMDGLMERLEELRFSQSEVLPRKVIYRFEPDSLDFLPNDEAQLDNLADMLKLIPEHAILLVEGHTASTGNPQNEMILSLERARRMTNELVQRGIGSERLFYNGWGGTRPLVNNAHEEGRSFNRRVEITILELPPPAGVQAAEIPSATEPQSVIQDEAGDNTADFFEWPIALIVKPDDIEIFPHLPEPDSGRLYRLQVGAFSDPVNADMAEELLETLGLTAGRERHETLIRVFAEGIRSDEVISAAGRIGEAGFRGIWIRETPE